MSEPFCEPRVNCYSSAGERWEQKSHKKKSIENPEACTFVTLISEICVSFFNNHSSFQAVYYCFAKGQMIWLYTVETNTPVKKCTFNWNPKRDFFTAWIWIQTAYICVLEMSSEGLHITYKKLRNTITNSQIKSIRSLTLIAVDIQGRNRDTLVYTPGFFAMAQPVPQLTTPSRRYRVVLDKQSSATKGPPLSPWNHTGL